MLGKLDHIAVAVDDLTKFAKVYTESLGAIEVSRDFVPEQSVEVSCLELGGVTVELVAPRGEKSPISAFLEKRGPGLHHLAFQVGDLSTALENLKNAGLEVISASTGHGGKKVAFLKPRPFGGVLIELVETGPESTE